MSINKFFCYVINCALLLFFIFIAFDQNSLHANSLSKEQVFAFIGVKKRFKTNHGSLIDIKISEYNFNQNIKKNFRFPGNYIIDSNNATINYKFTEMTPLSINEVMSQVMTSFDMHANFANLCTAIYVKNFELNFIIDNINFLDIKSELCEILPNKKILRLNNIKSNNFALDKRNFFLLDHNTLVKLLKISYFHNKKFNTN